MARYIDAEELQQRLEQIADEPDYLHDGDTWDTGVYIAGTQVDLMPTADVEEVVRCKDCKHSCMIGVCPFTYQAVYECLKGAKEAKGETDFCSCGERKDAE